jgi:hypothetical protein
MKAMYDAIMENMSTEAESEVPAELKEDLSAQEPAAQPMSHNPEAMVEKRQVNLYGQNRPQTTLDSVFAKINKQ